MQAAGRIARSYMWLVAIMFMRVRVIQAVFWRVPSNDVQLQRCVPLMREDVDCYITAPDEALRVAYNDLTNEVRFDETLIFRHTLLQSSVRSPLCCCDACSSLCLCSLAPQFYGHR